MRAGNAFHLDMTGAGESEPFLRLYTHAGLKLRHLLGQSFINCLPSEVLP